MKANSALEQTPRDVIASLLSQFPDGATLAHNEGSWSGIYQAFITREKKVMGGSPICEQVKLLPVYDDKAVSGFVVVPTLPNSNQLAYEIRQILFENDLVGNSVLKGAA